MARKRVARRSAADNRRWHSQVFVDAADPILIEDLEGNVLDLNDEAERAYGFAREELIGKPIKMLVPPERHVQADELLARCLAGGDVRNVEGLRWSRNREICPVLLTLSALKNESGETIAIATIAKDITEQKQMEAESRRMAKVFMDAADPILIEDLEGNVLDLNDEAERAYGFAREELIGKPIKMLVPPERHVQADELLARCLAGGDVRNVEGLRWSRNREICPVLLTLSALKNESGETIAIATIAKDITEQKQMEAELARERENLEIRVAERTRDLQHARTELQALAEKLSKYLSPQVYQSLFEGSRDARISTQRKWLTIFFSDLVDFTATSESLDPEELTTLLNEYLIEMTQIIFKYGGTLDKYIGDAILVFFGDPDTKGREEDAHACVSMALEMQERMALLRQHWSNRGLRRPFHARIGITSGHTTVGNFGGEEQMSYTIIGRQVNLANRLETNAAHDQILISKSTWSLVNSRMRCEPSDPIMAKGFDDPVEAYMVLGHLDPARSVNVIQRSSPGFSLWLDPHKLEPDDRESVVRQLQHVLSRLKES